jgi:transcriptional regulator with XRE-family HTH domain
MDGMDSIKWREMVGEAIETQRKRRGMSKAAAARAAGVSDTWWRALESGRVITPTGEEAVFNPSGVKAQAACRALGWPDDCIDRLRAGEPLGELDAIPVDTVQMLTAILGEIRNHRSDTGPGDRKLTEMPTRDDIRAVVEDAVKAVSESTRHRLLELVESISDLADAVRKNSQDVAALRSRLGNLEDQTPSAVTRPVPRKRSRATRT